MIAPALFALPGYLLGSIPTGVLLGRMVGKDPRAAGSGNIGASNVTRTMGKGLGAATLLVDLLKGLAPTLIVLNMYGLESALWCGYAAVVGHCFPIWLKFRGGKGVATAFGVVGALMPMVAVVSAMAWAMIVFFTRIPTLGSMAAAVLFVLLPRVETRPFEIHLFSLLLFLLIVVRHHSNLRVLKQRWQRRGRPRTTRPPKKRRRTR